MECCWTCRTGFVRIDDTLNVGDYFEANNGIATKTDNPNNRWRVMKITKPYSKKMVTELLYALYDNTLIGGSNEYIKLL